MKKVYLTIEEQVERCYPTAAKVEKEKLVEQYRKVIKEERTVAWIPESKEEEEQNRRHLQFHLDNLITNMDVRVAGRWQTVERDAMSATTEATFQG